MKRDPIQTRSSMIGACLICGLLSVAACASNAADRNPDKVDATGQNPEVSDSAHQKADASDAAGQNSDASDAAAGSSDASDAAGQNAEASDSASRYVDVADVANRYPDAADSANRRPDASDAGDGKSDASGCAPVEFATLNCSGPVDGPIVDPAPILASEQCKESPWNSPACFKAYIDYVCPGDPTVADGIDLESQMVIRLSRSVCGCDARLEPVDAEICDNALNVYFVAYADSSCDGCLEIFQLVSVPRTDLPVHKIFR